MNKWILILIFIIPPIFVLSFPYHIGEESFRPNTPKMWTGGTIPDEKGYFGWAQIYYETGKIYLPLEEIGPPKIQHIDFIIGDTPSKCIFMKIKVEEHDTQWETKTRDIYITVYNGKDEGLANETIRIEREHRILWNGTTDENGLFILHDVPPGFYHIAIDTPIKPLQMFFSTDYRGLNYPIEVSAKLYHFSSNVKVLIHVDHAINKNLSDVKIYLNKPEGKPIGFTDDYGNYILTLPINNGFTHVVAVKETLGLIPPVGSGIVEVNDRYAFANHWPPGYCYLIIPLWITKTIYYLPILLNFIAVASVYLFARKLYTERIALISSIITSFSSLGILILYSRGMADYASMSFATLGITLYIYSLQNLRKNWYLGLLGGLCFAYAVTMRYSTVVIILGPIVYTLLLIWKNPSKGLSKSFIVYLKKSLPFIIGLIIVGSMLAYYNTTLFGGPFNSGYQTSKTIREVNDSLIIEKPNKTMFQQYFHPSLESLQNLMDRILPQLFYLLPSLFIVPLTFKEWRRKENWFLWIWMLPILVIYMQLTWVGKAPMEDMRYFLPVLPAAAILTASIIDGENRFTMVVISLFILVGFTMGYYGIYWQINRRILGPHFNPPLIVLLLLIPLYLMIYARNLFDFIKKV
ncbi:MAG: hypothetical protein DRN12_03930 [Thermoplasmata archaeon]|nr:MAG: hypothetical protein DRN12_03930 [Thermoplasmata archaeon]